jgi:hypothetical protein
MVTAQRVNDFISQRGPVCDPCIAKELRLSSSSQASQITGALGTTSDFIREIVVCSICHHEKKVIRRAFRER